MAKRLDANSFGIMVGFLISALLGLALIVVILWTPQSLLFMAMILVPLLGVAFSTALLWLRTHQRTASIQRMRLGQCPKCEYDLTANASGTCPECGTLIPSGMRGKLTTGPPEP